MTVTSVLASMRDLLGPGLNPFARGAWCRRQRRRLAGSRPSVVWVRADALSWAEWGARRGYFEVQQMDGLSYLRALGAPTV